MQHHSGQDAQDACSCVVLSCRMQLSAFGVGWVWSYLQEVAQVANAWSPAPAAAPQAGQDTGSAQACCDVH